MTREKLFFEFIKHYQPVIGLRDAGEFTYCAPQPCVECKVADSCAELMKTEPPIIKVEDTKASELAKEKYPEYFV